MTYFDYCMHCVKFKGDCGNHPKDEYKHVIFDVPDKNMFDKNYLLPRCFIESRSVYKELYDRLQYERFDYDINNEKNDFNLISSALLIADKLSINKKDETDKVCARCFHIKIDFATGEGYCKKKDCHIDFLSESCCEFEKNPAKIVTKGTFV